MRRTQSERWLCHTHTAEGWMDGQVAHLRGGKLCVCGAWLGALLGVVAFPQQLPLRMGLKYLKGPALALSVGRAQWSEVAVLWHSLLVLPVGAGAAWVEPSRWCIHPLSSPHPRGWGGQHPFLHSFCTHHHKVCGVSCITVHAVLCFARAFYFFPWKAPEKPEMQKEI